MEQMEIKKNTTIAVSLKYLSNFLICKVELNLSGRIIVLQMLEMVMIMMMLNIFTFKGTKLYIPVVTLSAKGNQKLPKRLRKRFERSCYWNEYKRKSENKNTTNE